MYQFRWNATNDADWGQAIELLDNGTSLPLADAATASFKVEVKGRHHSAMLTASTADNTITKPDDNTMQWVFPASQMAALCAGETYAVGGTMTALDGTVTQLFIGSLAIVDGVVDA